MRPRTFPVVEVFGPTIQGEGPDAGTPAYFVRLGGCDFRCAWCDSMHAVEPALVRQAERLTSEQIIERLNLLAPGPKLVILTGGNPALHHADALVEALHANGLRIGLETQGTVWRPWVNRVDTLVVSPKPPSSGMTDERLPLFMKKAHDGKPVLKIVVFDDADYDYASKVHREYPDIPMWLSVGTSQEPLDSLESLTTRMKWLYERVSVDPQMADAKVLPQLHVLAWGHVLGV